MGWFWGAKFDTSDQNTVGFSGSDSSLLGLDNTSSSSGGCPVDYGKFTKNKKSSNSTPNSSANSSSQCPVDYEKMGGFGSFSGFKGFGRNKQSQQTQPTSSGKLEDQFVNDDLVLNPLNNMPVDISTEMAPGQKIKLSTQKTISTIPKGENVDDGVWEYPSPQQMLNAMLRKGKGQGIPEDAVESMVDIHNFLNEGAWQEILDWEKDYTKQTKIEPRLLQFTGRPYDISPRASMFLWLSKMFPQTFNSQPPFDRHDWTVLRSKGPNNGWSKIRYVIDYYSGPDDEDTGMPTFILDTRPALDSPISAYDRFTRWSEPIYRRAMGDFSER